MKKLLLTTLAVTLFACGGDQPTPAPDDTKPAADPDQTLSGRADGLSNYWTDIVGSIEDNGVQYEGSIDYPSYFHGLTIELEAGDEITVDVTATAEGFVRLYGPGYGSRPYFGAAKVRDYTFAETTFTYDAPSDGTYMIVYGPRYEWAADYTVTVHGALHNGQCFADDECGADEYCGDNGVRCITAPCDANFDICKPKEAEGSWCDRDSVCSAGAVCMNNACTVPTDECQTSADCNDEFCGYNEDSSRVCKPYAPEGERCGGFVRPQDYEACSPEFGCLAPTFIADIPGYCGTAVTVAELLANPADYDGKFVAIDGYIGVGPAFCTLMACTPSNPCCNSCGASQQLYDDASQVGGDGVALKENGSELGCGGNECTYMDNCDAEVGNHWVGGWFSVGNFGTTSIDVVRRMQGPTILP